MELGVVMAYAVQLVLAVLCLAQVGHGFSCYSCSRYYYEDVEVSDWVGTPECVDLQARTSNGTQPFTDSGCNSCMSIRGTQREGEHAALRLCLEDVVAANETGCGSGDLAQLGDTLSGITFDGEIELCICNNNLCNDRTPVGTGGGSGGDWLRAPARGVVVALVAVALAMLH